MLPSISRVNSNYARWFDSIKTFFSREERNRLITRQSESVSLKIWVKHPNKLVACILSVNEKNFERMF